MKLLLAIVFSVACAMPTFGQVKRIPAAPSELAAQFETAAEAAAFEGFDFDKLKINPNNLTEDDIEDLRENFLEAVKPTLIDKGDYPARLARIVKPIFLLHKADKSQTVVFNHRVPTVFTWKETFITFSTEAVDLLTDEEIAALVSHEIGHLYYAEALV